MKRITMQQLRDAGACREQVAIFAAEWPDGAEVSIENVRRAVALGLVLGGARHRRRADDLCTPQKRKAGTTRAHASTASNRPGFACGCGRVCGPPVPMPHWSITIGAGT